MYEKHGARKDEVFRIFLSLLCCVCLALLVMFVDVCAMPERRAHTSVIAFGGMCG